MDSIFCGTISNNIIEEICSILKCPLPNIKKGLSQPVPKEFSRLWVVCHCICSLHTLGKQAVSSLSLDPVHLRSHLLHSIVKDHLDTFPTAKQAKP